MTKSWRVLSLFDGMGCGRLALERAGIPVEKYFASEIDKHAITVTKAKFNPIHLGDVQKISAQEILPNGESLTNIDLLIGGSPCQGFSFAGRQLNFNDPRSKLFFEYVRLLKEIKPTYFLLENVVMKQEYQDVISEYLGVKPVEINSSLVSAQNRRRLYWANFPITQPQDKQIKLQHILEPEIPYKNQEIWTKEKQIKEFGEELDWSLARKASAIGRRIDERGHRQDYNKSIPITQCLEVRIASAEKSNCLTTVDKDNLLTPLPFGRHIDLYGRKLPHRIFTLKELCRLQTVPDDFFDEFPQMKNQARKMLGNGWTVEVIAHILRHLT